MTFFAGLLFYAMPPKARRAPAAPPAPPTRFEQTLIGLDARQLLELGPEFEATRFVGCELAEADLRHLRFEDCRFERCNLSNARLAGTALQNVAFAHCKLLGLNFNACQELLFAVHFEHCRLDYAGFGGRPLAGTRFAHCQLPEADFTNADLSGAAFADCDLTGTVFHGTRLRGADLRTATNYALDPEANELAGARLTLAGLPGLLGKYGLVVEEM